MKTHDELNDLFALIQEGKKHTIESSPGKRLLHELKQDLHVSNPFLTSSSKRDTKKIINEDLLIDRPSTIDRPTIDDAINEVMAKDIDTGPSIDDIPNHIASHIPNIPEVRPASQIYSHEEIDKYLRTNASFQQPNPDKPAPTIQALQDKVKFLEQAIGKIAATGPGSGEVNFRWLDDVERSTIDAPEADQEHVLRYNATTKKFFFGQLVGDHGEINSFKFDLDGPGVDVTPRMLSWNKTEDCLDIAQQDGTVLQTGLEHYFRVYNPGPNPLKHGTFVGFNGIHHTADGDHLPTIAPYTASTTAIPLFSMGVLTTDIPPGATGRVTVFGKVRGLDTTGDSGLGETWTNGDLLWSHPTMPGRLTKYQPTAPNPAISVAAVLNSHSTEGVILVRPTIFPRLWFGRFRDFTNQLAATANQPYSVLFGQTASAAGFHIDPTVTSKIVAEHPGLYKFDIRLQFTSANSSISKIWVWYRINGVDADGTGTNYTIASNGGIVVATLPYIVSLQQNDYVEIMWAVDNTSVSLISPTATSFAPGTPCAVVAITQANL